MLWVLSFGSYTTAVVNCVVCESITDYRAGVCGDPQAPAPKKAAPKKAAPKKKAVAAKK